MNNQIGQFINHVILLSNLSSPPTYNISEYIVGEQKRLYEKTDDDLKVFEMDSNKLINFSHNNSYNSTQEFINYSNQSRSVFQYIDFKLSEDIDIDQEQNALLNSQTKNNEPKNLLKNREKSCSNLERECQFETFQEEKYYKSLKQFHQSNEHQFSNFEYLRSLNKQC